MNHRIRNKHLILLQFWFIQLKIFQIRPRKFFKSNFLENARAKNFWLQIPIQRKISHRPVCIHKGSIVILPAIWANKVIAWALNAIFSEIGLKRNIQLVWTHTGRREILIRIWGQKNFSPTHFRENSIWKILRGRISKFFILLNQNWIWSQMICIFHTLWVIEVFSKKESYPIVWEIL